MNKLLMCNCSIIICTRNRAADLEPTLAAVLIAIQESTQVVELIIVDNGSTDETATISKAVASNYPNVRFVMEPSLGKGFAYNRGIAESRGPVLLFTDDDVRPPSNWIDAMCAPITSGAADAVAGGVAIAPTLLRTWMTHDHRGSLFHSADIIVGPEGPELIGANMAIGRHVFDVLPGFDPELGPGAAGFKDETLVAWQMRSAGMNIVGRPDILVEHHFDPDRLSRRSFIARSTAHGRSDAYVRYHYFHCRVKVPRIRALLKIIELWIWRATHPLSCFAKDGFDLREGLKIYERSVMSALVREQRRPRNYALKGLVKINGVQLIRRGSAFHKE